jgi:hypothetical protein
MSLAGEVGVIVEDLRAQVSSLRNNLKRVEEEVPKDSPPSNLFSGPMMASLMSHSEPEWFSKFLHSLDAMTCQHLMLCTLLCLRHGFKQLLLDSPELQSMFLPPIRQYTPVSTEIDSLIWYKSLMYSLLKSKQDKPRIISPQLKSAGYSFSEQTRLEESIAQNPQMASALGAGQNEEWSTDVQDANILLGLVVSDTVVKNLVTAKAVEAIACVCRPLEYRNLVVRNGGVQTLIEGCSKAPTSQHKEQLQVALARLCMTTYPHLWKYPQVIELANACFDLISTADYELYQFEGGIGLTNLLSTSQEALDHIGAKENSVASFFELISSSQDERVQLVGAELFCNLCRSETVVKRLSEGGFKDELTLIPFLIENGSEEMQSAASGALAILTSSEDMIPPLKTIIKDGAWLARKVSSTNISQDVELRIASIMSNVIDFTEDSRLRSDLSEEMRELRHRVESRKETDSDESQRLLSIVKSYS